MTNTKLMTNREFIHSFETDSLPQDSFHHAEHIRLAFAYLSEYPVLQALDKFATALKSYAAARGKSQLYHETITHAYFFLVRERMARGAAENRSGGNCPIQNYSNNDWDEFARANLDLFTWKDGILTRYYHQATLESDLARNVFVFPDKCCRQVLPNCERNSVR
jgi:hypothetical protein